MSDARDTADQSTLIARQTSEGMQQQLREIEQVSTPLHEMSATANASAQCAAQAADAARHANQVNREGLEVITRTTNAIHTQAHDMNEATWLSSRPWRKAASRSARCWK
ncbi:hypothetical protein ACSFE6_01050 [Pseudomonas baetica]